MIDFSMTKSILIPEGEVVMITRGGEVLWQKKEKKYNQELLYLESTTIQYIDTGVLLKTTMDFELVGSITENTTTGWLVGAPTWIGVHKKTNTVAVTQTSTGNTYNTVNIGEKFTLGLFGDKAYFNGVETNTITKRNNSTLTLYLFAYHHTDGTGSIRSAGRIYGFKIWDNGELIRDFIPVLDLEDKPCMYDKVTEELFYNVGTGEFKYGFIPNEGLPYYKEIEYLESEGTQWIDTETPDVDNVSFSFAVSNNSADIKLFGNNKAYPGYNVLALYQSKFRGTSLEVFADTWYNVTIDITSTPTLTIKEGTNEFTANSWFGTTLPTTAPDTSLGLATPLIGWVEASGTNYNGTRVRTWVATTNTMSIKNFIAYKNGVLVRDLIPVLDYHNTPCMYDNVTKTFFYNMGKGDFKYANK